MSKYLNDAYTLRIPAELKAKVAESAKAHNRSMNADIVARLEQSFESNTSDQLKYEKLLVEFAEMFMELQKNQAALMDLRMSMQELLNREKG